MSARRSPSKSTLWPVGNTLPDPPWRFVGQYLLASDSGISWVQNAMRAVVRGRGSTAHFSFGQFWLPVGGTGGMTEGGLGGHYGGLDAGSGFLHIGLTATAARVNCGVAYWVRDA